MSRVNGTLLEQLRGVARVAAAKRGYSPTHTVRHRGEFDSLTVNEQAALLDYCAGLEAGVLIEMEKTRADKGRVMFEALLLAHKYISGVRLGSFLEPGLLAEAGNAVRDAITKAEGL